MDVYATLFQALSNQRLLDLEHACMQLLDNPFVVCDVEYRILSQCPKETYHDLFWDTMLLEKKVSFEMLETIQLDKYQETLDQNNHLIYIDYGIGTRIPRVVASILSHGKVIGFLCILFARHPYHKQDDKTIHAIANAFSLYMCQNTYQEEKNYGANKLLLQEAFQSNAFSSSTLERLEYLCEKATYYRVAITSVLSGRNQIVYLNQFMRYLDEHAKALSCVIEDSLYILFPLSKKDNDSFYKTLQWMLKEAKLFTLHFGISDAFSSLQTMPLHRVQAIHAFPYANSQEPFCFFSNIAMKDLKKTLSRVGDLTIFEHPLLHQLKMYDEQNHSELYHTLQVYILSMNNPALSTKALNIHRNTLLYRLSKIEEIGEVNLKEQDIANQLLFSFFIQTD